MKHLLILLCFAISISAFAQTPKKEEPKQKVLKVKVPKSTQKLIVELDAELFELQKLEAAHQKKKQILFQTLLGDSLGYEQMNQARFANDTLYIPIPPPVELTSAGKTEVKPKTKNK